MSASKRASKRAGQTPAVITDQTPVATTTVVENNPEPTVECLLCGRTIPKKHSLSASNGYCCQSNKECREARGLTGKPQAMTPATLKVAAAQASKSAEKQPKAPQAKKEKKVDESLSKTIHLLVASNPKKVGSASYERFAAYQEGMTVQAALKAGVKREDIAWDTRHQFISIA